MRIVVIATANYSFSHADVIMTRWLDHRPSDVHWGWPGPRSSIVSAFFEQFPGKNDIARATCAKHGVPIFNSIEGALKLGGDTLAADGVLLIGEHGDYPYNEFGQKLYPRKRFFDEIVRVFQATGGTAPVFCDKHLSWDFDTAREMVMTADRLGFMLLAGSSYPHCHYRPQVDATDRAIDEVLAIYPPPIESYGFHSLEFVQSIIEGRAGGESGVRSLTASHNLRPIIEGDTQTTEMFHAALALQELPVPDADAANPERRPPSTVFTVDYNDGLRATHVYLNNRSGRHTLAIRFSGDAVIHTTMPVGGARDTTYCGHFAALARVIEDAFFTGHRPFPIERTLMTTGLLQAMMQAAAEPDRPLLTPHLDIRYKFTERVAVPLSPSPA